MRIQFFVFVPIIFLVACNQKNKENDPSNTDTSGLQNSPKANLNVQIESFKEIDSSGVLMFPLSMGETEKRGKSYYKDIPYSSHWNIIFYNRHSNEYYLLSDSLKMVINRYGQLKNSDDYEETGSASHLFFHIRVNDQNNDKKLTDDDPEYLFVSDKLGKNLRQISPNGNSVYSWRLLGKSEVVVMIVIRDSNKDNKFDEEDEKAAYRFNLRTDSNPTEIFLPDFKDKLKTLYDRDWKRLGS